MDDGQAMLDLDLMAEQERICASQAAAATDTVTELRWHNLIIYGTPCSDRSVLCADKSSWFAGWYDHDAETWIDCASGAAVGGVTHWAEPLGPVAC